MKALNSAEIKKTVEWDEYSETRAEYVERKTKAGFKIYYPEPNELVIDLDGEKEKQFFIERVQRLGMEIGCNYSIYPSETKGHYHAIVKIYEGDENVKLDRFERLALQAVLGSDLTKEMLSIFRIWNGDEFPTLLAMKPEVFY